MNKNRVLVGAGIVVAGATVGAVVSHKITTGLVKIALERTEPKSMAKSKSKISKSTKMDSFESLVMEKAETLANKEYETISVCSRDGLKLTGHWYPCAHPKRIIVAMHGWRSSWNKDFGMIADFWHEEGCSILFAEQRAQNNSDGEYMTFGYMERYDCLDWIQWVNEHTEGKYPVYLAGVSMGASTVLMTAGLDLPKNVHGVMADCGFTSANDIWKYVIKENLHLSYGLRGYMIDTICKKKINTSSKSITTLTAMRETAVPILLVHGSDDDFVPIWMTYENYKACNAPKELLIVPGARHGQSYWKEQEKYENSVKSFWKKYDGDLLIQR